MTTDTMQAAADELIRLLAEARWSYRTLCVRFGWRVISWDKNRHPNPPPIHTLTEGDLRQFAYLLKTNILRRE